MDQNKEVTYEVFQIAQEEGAVEFIPVGEYTDSISNLKSLLLKSIEQGIDDMLNQMKDKEIGKGQIIMPYIYFEIVNEEQELH